MAAGRLRSAEGLRHPGQSAAQIAQSHPAWTLVIYGEGPERASLEAQIRVLGLSGRVSLPGVTSDMPGALTETSGCSFSLRATKSYPNVLVEALAASCPVVATDCPGAVADILCGGEYGLLVSPEDTHALAVALTRAISDQGLRGGLSAQAREAVSGLDVGIVGRRWIALFDSLRE